MSQQRPLRFYRNNVPGCTLIAAYALAVWALVIALAIVILRAL